MSGPESHDEAAAWARRSARRALIALVAAMVFLAATIAVAVVGMGHRP
ncbi:MULTISPECIES: hypothetical protein [Caulobacter]|jgi:hypothetical protein|uniref:Uncharacterized protein n=1 Tax=Caulobacter vibrioides OR37 TaxID=1292034 RepID=R0D365_CAUVI|nr:MULTISPECIES: hypothetical protein [Caulobacter]ENZ82870.1 hypothetical protein OR37_01064 [Caulobacter vibrioides OR37]